MIEITPLLALRSLAEHLRKHRRQFALAGGLAVTARSEPRFTRDVDVCVIVENDSDAEALSFELRSEGYQVTATVEHQARKRLATVRLRGPEGVACDLILASSGIEHEVVTRAAEVEVEAGLVLPVARTEELLALKVLSWTEQRPHDLVDFQRLAELNPDFDREAVAHDLRTIEARGYHRDQDLLSKLAEMMRTVG